MSAAERGHGDRLPLYRLAAIASAVGAYLSIRILLDGGGLDRLRDRRHAATVERMVARLISEGWEVATEVSFSVFGERGSIDILAFHPAARSLLVIEVKSVVPDIGGMLMTLDRKVRLAPDLARARGWSPSTVSRVLVLPEHARPDDGSQSTLPRSKRPSPNGAVTSGAGCETRREPVRLALPAT